MTVMPIADPKFRPLDVGNGDRDEWRFATTVRFLKATSRLPLLAMSIHELEEQLPAEPKPTSKCNWSKHVFSRNLTYAQLSLKTCERIPGRLGSIFHGRITVLSQLTNEQRLPRGSLC